MDEAKDHSQRGKGKKDSLRHRDSEFVVAVDKVHKQMTSKLNHVSFDKIVKLSCHNHGYLVKHTLEDYDLIKLYFKCDYKITGTDTPSGSIGNEQKGEAFLDPKGCLMIFGGPVACESRRCQKLMG